MYVCRVIERKISRGRVFLVTDGGLHHHLAASGNFGQVLRKNYPVVVANKVARRTPRNRFCRRPLCTPLDLLADQMELGAGATRRPRRRAAIRCLRPDGESHGLPGPSAPGGASRMMGGIGHEVTGPTGARLERLAQDRAATADRMGTTQRTIDHNAG